jgi:hypothetical protein
MVRSWLCAVTLLLLERFSGGAHQPTTTTSPLQSYVLTPNSTDFDCDFGDGEACLWTWEQDNYTGRTSDGFPGQHGFYRLTAEDVARLQTKANASRTAFFGPKRDRLNSSRGTNALVINFGAARACAK